jgi:hypothetical protein
MPSATSANPIRPSLSATVRLGLMLMLLFCASGASCRSSLRSPFAPLSPPAPEVLAVGASLDQVIAAVNQNASRIVSYQTNNASVKIPGMPGIPALSGKIAAQRPGRLRLMASSLMGPEVDLGANDELFWFWVRRNQPPAVYFARHDQFAGTAAQQMMPIEPQWLLDALGLAMLNPGDAHEGPAPAGDGRVEIKSVVQTRNGPITKRTVIEGRRALVLEQHVYDAAGNLVASVVARSHRYYPQHGVSLPQELDIQIPASELALSIDVGTVEINTLGDNPQLWTMPTIAGSPPYDIGSAAAGSVTPVGQQLSQADWYGPGPPTAAPAPIPVAPLTTAVGGLPAPPLDPFTAGDAAGMQRLPSGGVAAQSTFAR